MRRLVAALIAVALAVLLAGCGGGGAATSGSATTEAQAAAPAPVIAPGGQTITDRSAPEDPTVFEPFPTGDAVPDALAEKIKAKEPMLILFVNGSQKVTNEVRSAVDTAIKRNSGVVGLAVFDLGKYASINASGVAVVDAAAISADKVGSQAVILAHELGVTALPYIVMTDDQGYLVFRHRGLVDEDFLQMHMERLTD